MARGDDIQERLIDFAVSIIGLSSALPKTKEGRHVAGQVLRSGTAPAPNYGEARGAESLNDFVHKLSIALKELNETDIWLAIILKAGMLTNRDVDPIKNEGEELGKILGASIKTVLSRKPEKQKCPF